MAIDVYPLLEAALYTLIVISIVALIAGYTRIPYTVALVFAGLLLSHARRFPVLRISPEVFMTLVLPPLIFEAAFHIDIDDFKRDADAIMSYAFIGTLLSAALTGLFAYFLLGFSFLEALLLGVIVSPTDPVAVIAIFRRLGIPGRLSLIIEGESLFNDGVVIVSYSAIVTALLTGIFGLMGVVWRITYAVIGGMIIGGLLGYVVYKIIHLVDDRFVEILLTFISAYGIYLIAESFDASGIIAVAVGGLIISNYGVRLGMTSEARGILHTQWEFVAFLANSVAFIFIGMYLKLQLLLTELWIVSLSIAGILATRAAMVYLVSRALKLRKKVIPTNWQHVIAWSGLRGAISIVLILGLTALPIQHAERIMAITFGVVLFSILVQGLSLSTLIQRLGLVTNREERPP